MKRDTRSAYRSRAKATEGMIDAARDELRAERDAQWRAVSAAAAEREAARVRLTRDDLVGATHVRLPLGWFKVARLNPKTVAVETGYSWTDKYSFDKVLEARTIREGD